MMPGARRSRGALCAAFAARIAGRERGRVHRRARPGGRGQTRPRGRERGVSRWTTPNRSTGCASTRCACRPARARSAPPARPTGPAPRLDPGLFGRAAHEPARPARREARGRADRALASGDVRLLEIDGTPVGDDGDQRAAARHGADRRGLHAARPARARPRPPRGGAAHGRGTRRRASRPRSCSPPAPPPAGPTRRSGSSRIGAYRWRS